MRRFEELPLEDGLALIDVLIDQGMLTRDRLVTPLGEEYINSSRELVVAPARERLAARHPLALLDDEDEFDTRPLNDLTNTDSIIKTGDRYGET